MSSVELIHSLCLWRICELSLFGGVFSLNVGKTLKGTEQHSVSFFLPVALFTNKDDSQTNSFRFF